MLYGKELSIQLYDTAELEAAENAEALKKVSIQYFIPEKPSGTAIIICPGGAYTILCDTYEGEEVAHWLNEMGITAVLLRYRVGKNLNAAPLEDALNAVRFVRKNAVSYKIAPDRIGIIGFSAGGHLASAVATHGKNDAAVNFHILIYPMISLTDKLAHKTSQQNFLGALNSEEDKKQYSSELHISKDTSMAFVAHSATDRTVSVENSRMYVAALKKHNIPVTYLELPKGGHGFGSGRSPEWKVWQKECRKWLSDNKFNLE